MNVEILSPAVLRQWVSILKEMSAAALKEQDVWLARLDKLRGNGNSASAQECLRALGREKVDELLGELIWPPTPDDLRICHRHGPWPLSKTEAAIEALPESLFRFELHVDVLPTQEQLERFKAQTLFWEMLGVHPEDVEACEQFDPRMAFALFTRSRTTEELAKRYDNVAEQRNKYELFRDVLKDMALYFLGFELPPAG